MNRIAEARREVITLELDLVLSFQPPMSDHGGGIVLTRTIELPFAPFDGLHLFAREMDQCPYPPGFPLKNVAWDLERGRFLADTHLSISDSVAMIPVTLADYRERGWKPGSYQDYYHADDKDDDEDERAEAVAPADGPAGSETSGELGLEFDELEKLESMPPRKRPREFNRLVQALVRCMVDCADDFAAAYAIDKTGWVLSDRVAQHNRDEEHQTWLRAYRYFNDLPEPERRRWYRRVRRYPDIHSIEPFVTPE